jgi:hypothetical protein
VRERLSAHEYPREVEFVDSMPLTTTGKVIRRIFRDRARREAEGGRRLIRVPVSSPPVVQQVADSSRAMLRVSR